MDRQDMPISKAQELEDAEDDLAFAQHEAEKAAGTLRTVPHDDVREQLGLPDPSDERDSMTDTTEPAAAPAHLAVTYTERGDQ